MNRLHHKNKTTQWLEYMEKIYSVWILIPNVLKKHYFPY